MVSSARPDAGRPSPSRNGPADRSGVSDRAESGNGATSVGDWRDPEIFGPLEERIESAGRNRRKRGYAQKSLSPARTRELQAVIRQHFAPIREFIEHNFAAQLRQRPDSLKRLVTNLVRREIPPIPKRPGRPHSAAVTRAASMKAQQVREIRDGIRPHIDWGEIAAACIAAYNVLRFDWQRKQARKRLVNSVARRKK